MTDDSLSQRTYRIEGEVQGEIPAEIMKETFESNPECSLIAFEEVDG